MNSNFKCDRCKTKSAHKRKLKDHKERNHILSSDSICVHYITHVKCHVVMEYKTNSKFKCDHCKMKFDHKHKLKTHKERTTSSIQIPNVCAV